jgi:dimethylglycine dehydrogenase
VGWATNIRLMRVNYCGELGWEIHHPIAFQHHILNAIEEAGVDLGLQHVGFRALDSIRMEKSYRAVTHELTTQNTLLEAGMSRFISSTKSDFIGATAARATPYGDQVQLVTLEIECVRADVEPSRNLAIRFGDQLIGLTTSGAYGHFTGKHLAMAFLPEIFATEGTSLNIEILGERFDAMVIADSPHDPENVRPRG